MAFEIPATVRFKRKLSFVVFGRYLAPEYFMYGIVHEKTDVFAYGVLLLELISGRQPINHAQQSLVVWVRIALSASVSEVGLLS